MYRRRILAFAAVVEAGTGLAAMAAPALVIELLLGLAASADGLLVGRCFGIAVLALGWSCWPGSAPLDGAAPLRAMFAYNVLIAAFLAYVGVAAYPIGVLLWPAAALHAAVALLLVWTSREGEGA